MINPLTSADDFARQLSLDELTSLADQVAPHRAIFICSAVPDGLAALRQDVGAPRVDALLRELTLFVRRNLRGADAIAVQGEELVLMVDAPALLASAIADRLLSAVRGHVFSAGASDRPLRITLAMGVAPARDRIDLASQLLASARAARRVVGADGHRVAHAHALDALDLGRFVGRAEPLAQLVNFLDDMVRGIGRVVAVVGESGVGASALVRSLQPEVRLRGGSLVVGHCHPHVLPAPYAVWADVLRGIRRLPVKTTRVWRELPGLDPALDNGTAETSGGSKTRLLEELADFLRLAAQQRPLVILLEDLQWADAASWDALEYLISQLESERILIMMTIVSGTSDDDALERWRGLSTRPRHHEFLLTRLTRDDAKRWLEGAMRSAEPARELLAYLYRHSEGSPLLLMQLLRDLVERGHLARTDGLWHSHPVGMLPSHVDLDAVVRSRVGRLAPDARSLLDAAAALGRGAIEDLLGEIAGLTPDATHAALRQLVASGLLVASSERERPTYLVAHEDVARAVRGMFSADRARALHAAVANALVAQRARSSAEIAGHYELAGDRGRTFRFALDAADDALALHETFSASTLLAAAERAAPSNAELAEVRMRMASLAEVAGRYEEAEALADQALEWYAGQGDLMRAVQIRRTRTLVRIKRGKGAAETLTELLSLERDAVAAGAEMERAAVLLLIGQMHWRLGDFRSAQRVAEEAMAIAERGDDPALLADCTNRLGVTIQFESPTRARELFSKSFAIGTTLGDPFRRIRGLNNLGVLELFSANWDEARRVLALAAEQSRTAGLLESWGRAELNLGVLAARIGDYDGAARALSEALRITSMVQSSADQLYATYNMAHVERERGHHREAGDLYGLVSELAERIGQVEVQAGAHAGMGLCRFLVGDLSGARRALTATMPLTERLTEWFQGREIEVALQIELLLLEDRGGEAATLFERALAMAAPNDLFGGAWLTAEFGRRLLAQIPAAVADAVRKFAALPEVLDNPRIRDQFTVLKVDTNVSVDRIE